MPVPQNDHLAALWRLNPTEAAWEVNLALMVEGGDRDRAAERLGVSRRTLFRYLKRIKENQ